MLVLLGDWKILWMWWVGICLAVERIEASVEDRRIREDRDDTYISPTGSGEEVADSAARRLWSKRRRRRRQYGQIALHISKSIICSIRSKRMSARKGVQNLITRRWNILCP
jgi:hypothetical protein